MMRPISQASRSRGAPVAGLDMEQIGSNLLPRNGFCEAPSHQLRAHQIDTAKAGPRSLIGPDLSMIYPRLKRTPEPFSKKSVQ